MIVLINNPVLETYIFSALLLFALIISTRWSRRRGFFPISVSQELKGLAILMIIFAHVTYALVSDSRFLNPLATMGGVGVNLFLILSGYGLVASALRRPLSVKKFYKKRLLRLYIPFWICLTIFYLLDYFALKIHYDWSYVLRSFLGLFWHADLYADVDSPFWYFSWIVLYYLLFPWLFSRRRPWLSALGILGITYALVASQPAFLNQVIHLYRVHLIAFPLGMILGWLFNEAAIWQKAKALFHRYFPEAQPAKRRTFYALAGLVIVAALWYFLNNSSVGASALAEDVVSNITCLLILALFLIKRIEIRLLYWFGIYSYEIYMFHWPLMYRYDFLFKIFPVWLALLLWLAAFIGLGWLLQTAIKNFPAAAAKAKRYLLKA